MIPELFKDISLLETAFTHSSYANDFLGDPKKGNERLEFLGDAVLDAIVGKELYDRFPDENEGFLTRLRAEIVCEKSLGEAAIAHGLNEFLRLGNGEEGKGGRTRISMAADAMEAVIAAVFLDGGLEAASEFVQRLLGETINAARQGELPGDYKTELQILCQKKGRAAKSAANPHITEMMVLKPFFTVPPAIMATKSTAAAIAKLMIP